MVVRKKEAMSQRSDRDPTKGALIVLLSRVDVSAELPTTNPTETISTRKPSSLEVTWRRFQLFWALGFDMNWQTKMNPMSSWLKNFGAVNKGYSDILQTSTPRQKFNG
jgi:hypothetical protein